MKDTCPVEQTTQPPATDQTSEQEPATSEQDLYGNAYAQEQMECAQEDGGAQVGTFFDRLMAGTEVKTAFPFNAAFGVLGNNVALETELEAGVNPGHLKANKFKLTVSPTTEVIQDGREKKDKYAEQVDGPDDSSPDWRRADQDEAVADFVVEFSNEEEFSLSALGLNIGQWGSLAVDEQGVKGSVSKGFGPVTAGIDFDGTTDPWKTSLNMGFDAFEVLFGGGLKAAKDAAAKQNIDFDLGAKFDAKLDLLDNASPAVRIENLKAQFDASIGTRVKGKDTGDGEHDDKGTGFGDFGAKAAVSVGMETDYAEGTAEDPWSKTTGTASATLTVTLFGQTFGFDIKGEQSSSGTYLEAHEAQKRLNEIALEAAYGQVCSEIASTGDADGRDVVKTLMQHLSTSYQAADAQLKAATGVSPIADYGYGPATEIYQANASEGRFQVVGWHDQVNHVIARNNQAKMIHEWLTFDGCKALGGDYTSSGDWSGEVSLRVTGDDAVEGDYGSDGSLMGTLDEQTVTGRWFEGGGDREGSFTMQVQDDGDRLYGYFDVDGQKQEWILDRR